MKTTIQSVPLSHAEKRGDTPRLQGARPRTSVAKNFRAVFSRLRRLAWCLNLCRSVFVSEFGSLVPRMEYRLRRNLDAGGVDLGTTWKTQPNGHLQRNTRTQARIRDTQRMLSSQPWATAVDLAIFLEGWDRGAECVLAESGKSCIQRPGEDT